MVAGYTDHLIPWDGAYQTTQLLGGDSRFVLSNGGHIQAILNPPDNPKAFVHTQLTCVFGYRRRSDGPAMSVVYYVPTDDDELLVSTMADRSKAIAVARDPKVSLCVLDERWPFT